MKFPEYVFAEVGGKEELKFDVSKVEGLDYSSLPVGGNIFYEFARRQLKASGYPELLISTARFRLE